MAQKQRLTMERARKLVEAAADEWLSKHTEDSIQAWVYSELTKGRDIVLHQVLGFEKRWTGWEIDHCNGRMSTVTKFIEESAGQAARKWLSEQCGQLPALNKTQVDSLRREYIHAYETTLRGELVRLAKQRASERAAEMINQFMPPETPVVAEELAEQI